MFIHTQTNTHPNTLKIILLANTVDIIIFHKLLFILLLSVPDINLYDLNVFSVTALHNGQNLLDFKT